MNIQICIQNTGDRQVFIGIVTVGVHGYWIWVVHKKARCCWIRWPIEWWQTRHQGRPYCIFQYFFLISIFSEQKHIWVLTDQFSIHFKMGVRVISTEKKSFARTFLPRFTINLSFMQLLYRWRKLRPFLAKQEVTFQLNSLVSSA